MFTNSVSKIFIVLLVLVIAAVTASFISHSANFSSANRSYDSVEQVRLLRSAASSYDSIEQVRMGRTVHAAADRSSVESKEQVLREYHLGERYGVTPGQYTQDQVRREYWLGERYGQTP